MEGCYMKNNYKALSQGQIIKVSFDPAEGHEQKKYRPAIVLSNDDANYFQ